MSAEKPFDGKVAIVTGAGTGIGAATARLLARRGASVTLVGRRPEPVREVAAEINARGGSALAVPADVSDPAALADAVSRTVEQFGGLHFAVNNAGVASESHDLPDLPLEVWDVTIATNLSALFYAMRVQLPAIDASGGGAIVNVSSVFGDRGLPARAAYTASKHGVRGLTRSAAADWATRGIRINELQPGVISTPMIAEGGEEENAQIAQTIPSKRLGNPAEVAGPIAFLLSEDASYITGAHLAVDGGFLI